MKKGQFIIERNNPYNNTRNFWNGATWVTAQDIALPYADDEARTLLRRFNKQGHYQFVYRLEKVK